MRGMLLQNGICCVYNYEECTKKLEILLDVKGI